MILDWHSHIYTPEEAADDLRTWDGNTGPSWGERGCPMVLENFVRALLVMRWASCCAAGKASTAA